MLELTPFPSFAQLGMDAAREFLQTIAVVDDDARFAPNAVVGGLQAPAEIVGHAGDVQKLDAAARRRLARQSHPLDVKALGDGFASYGMASTVLRPEKADQRARFLDATVRLAARVDVLVVDWHIDNDNGQLAVRLIKQVLESDAKRARLRLIAIYTGDPDLRQVAERLASRLGQSFSLDQGDCTLSADRARIVILAKHDTKVIPDYENLVVAEANLPLRIIEEFARHANGLLSNLVLAYLASIRDNTHLLISRFPRRLDSAYVADRIAQSTPDDAVTLALALIAQAVEASVDAVALSAFVSERAIGAWLVDQRAAGATFPVTSGHQAINLDDQTMVALISQGRDSVSRPDGVTKANWSDAPSLTSILCGGEDPRTLDHDFAQLTTLARMHTNSRSDEVPPRLGLGSILYRLRDKPGNPRFLLCVQPACDSVRLEAVRAFLFLPVQVEGAEQRFDLAFCDIDGNRTTAVIEAKPFNLVKIAFEPDDGTKCVVARRRGKRWVFVDDSNAAFAWLADLRDEQAQRIVHYYASQLSRVGVAESEWARTSRGPRF
jgi:hypothetical protein